MASSDHLEAAVPRTPVLSFTPAIGASMYHLVGGVALPLASLVVFTALFLFLGWLWSDLEQNPPKGSIELAVKSVVLFTVAFAAGTSLFHTIKALAGRRPQLTGRLTVPDGTAIGGTLRGEVSLSRGLRPDQSAVITLTCRVGGMSTEDGYLWQQSWEQVVDAGACADREATRIPVAIDVPAEAPPSGVFHMKHGMAREVVWSLYVSVEPKGPGFVFVVPLSARNAPTSLADRVLPYRHEGPPPTRPPASSRIRVTAHGDGGATYHFPRPDWFAGIIWWWVLTLPAWVLLPWLAWREWWDWPGNLAWMLVLAALVNALPALSIILHRPRLQVGTDAVRVPRLFFPGRRLHPRETRRAVAGQALDIGGSPSWVWVECASWRSPIRVRACPSTAEARWLAADIDRVLGLVKERRTAMMDGRA